MSRPARRFDLVAVGDPVIDVVIHAERLPAWGSKALGRPAGRHAGGTEANAACAASRLGMRTALYGAVGDDEHGQMIVADLQRFGVALDHLETMAGTATASTVIFVSAEGDRAVVYLPLPAQASTRTDLSHMLATTRLVYTMPYDSEAYARLAEAARSAGTEVAVDIEQDVLHDPRVLDCVMRLSDVLFFNEEGFVAATDAAPTLPVLRDLLLCSRAHTAVVTLGARGAIAADRLAAASHPAFDAPVVDTTGAGDTFNAAFLVARSGGRGLRDSLAFACAAASHSIGAMGARTRLPSADDVEKLLLKAF